MSIGNYTGYATIALLCVVGVLLAWLVVIGVCTRVRVPSCGRCGYEARGLETFRCPECGADLRIAGLRTGWGHLHARGRAWIPCGAWMLLVVIAACFAPLLHVRAPLQSVDHAEWRIEIVPNAHWRRTLQQPNFHRIVCREVVQRRSPTSPVIRHVIALEFHGLLNEHLEAHWQLGSGWVISEPSANHTLRPETRDTQWFAFRDAFQRLSPNSNDEYRMAQVHQLNTMLNESIDGIRRIADGLASAKVYDRSLAADHSTMVHESLILPSANSIWDLPVWMLWLLALTGPPVLIVQRRRRLWREQERLVAEDSAA